MPPCASGAVSLAGHGNAQVRHPNRHPPIHPSPPARLGPATGAQPTQPSLSSKGLGCQVTSPASLAGSWLSKHSPQLPTLSPTTWVSTIPNCTSCKSDPSEEGGPATVARLEQSLPRPLVETRLGSILASATAPSRPPPAAPRPIRRPHRSGTKSGSIPPGAISTTAPARAATTALR